MTRRTILRALAGLPVVGKLVAAAPNPIRPLLAPSFEETFWSHVTDEDFNRGETLLVGDWGPDMPSFDNVPAALKWARPGHGDTIVLAAGHVEKIHSTLDFPAPPLYR